MCTSNGDGVFCNCASGDYAILCDAYNNSVLARVERSPKRELLDSDSDDSSDSDLDMDSDSEDTVGL